MGFYLRKSIRVGPFRFNLSKSGMGVSTGIPGFRVGTNTRGNYVHMGRKGFYYRTSLSPSPSHTTPTSSKHDVKRHDYPDTLKEIESGDLLKMVDSSSASLLAEFKEKQRKIRSFPFTLTITIIVILTLLIKAAPLWILLFAGTLLSALCIVATTWDQTRKTVVLFYDIDPDIEPQLTRFFSAFSELNSSRRIWHIEAQGDCDDHKRHAGATSLIRRTQIRLTETPPHFVKTNLPIPSIPVGQQTLCFFPDRLLVFAGNEVGAVSYKDLNVTANEEQFIENEGVPSDARIVDKTWRYVNKKGGPDRRFNDNYEIPIALYGKIHFGSATGLNELIQLSKLGAGEKFINAIKGLANISTG